MFTILNKKSTFPIASILKTDMHSHILPGIDDGSPDVSTSLKLIDGMIALGYEKLICTPHIMSDLYPNTPETIQHAYGELQTALKEKGYTIPISYAAEYLIDEYFEEKINQGLLCVYEKFVLVETMFTVLPPNIEQILFLLKTQGYQPILAHPERYHFMDKTLSALAVFEKHGCYLQPNILSFAGYYGTREQELALKLLEAGKIHFLGSDLHHVRHLNALKHFRLKSKTIQKLEAIPYLNSNLEVNAILNQQST